MINTKKYKKSNLILVFFLLTLSISVLVYSRTLGFQTLCGWEFPKDAPGKNWSCLCVGIPTLVGEKRVGAPIKTYCTGFNFSYNKLINLLDYQHPIYKENSISLQPPSINTPANKTIDTESTVNNITDLTLNPTTDWTEGNLCNIVFRRHPDLKINNWNGLPELKTGTECSFSLTTAENATIKPTYLYVTVYNNYDGGSRRDFYFKTQDIDPTKDPSYLGAEEFVSGANKGLKLMFKAPIKSYLNNQYLIVKNSTTLINTTPGLVPSEDDVLKMFLTSIK